MDRVYRDRIKGSLIGKDHLLKNSAVKLGMTPLRLTRILTGDSRPSSEELLKLASYLNVRVERLFE